jgi:hypothetical protein
MTGFEASMSIRYCDWGELIAEVYHWILAAGARWDEPNEESRQDMRRWLMGCPFRMVTVATMSDDGLLEYGCSINSYWLTEKGKELFDFMSSHGYDTDSWELLQ